MVGTWLTNSVSPKLQASIIYEDTTLEIWKDLKNRFAQTNGPRVFNLQKEIVELHQGEMSITDFFAQLKVFWDQLQNLSPFPSCTCGKCVCNINKWLTDLQVKESVMKFFMGFNDSFSQVRTQDLLMDPIPSLSKVYSLLIQEDTQRSVPNASIAKVDSTVLVAKMSNDNHGTNLASTSSGGKGKDRPICIVARLVTQWINAINCMVFHKGLSSRTNPPWHIKSLQNSCLLLLQCITRILPSHLNNANNFLLCLVLQTHLLQYHLRKKKPQWLMWHLPILQVCQ